MNIFATQNLKMNKFFFVLFVFLTQLNFAQTQEEILKEADKRNISTKRLTPAMFRIVLKKISKEIEKVMLEE